MDIDRLMRPNLRGVRRYEPGEDHAGAVKLSSNENPRPPHPRIVRAVQDALGESNRYPESGCPELTAALASRHGVTRDEILVGNGSNEVIDLMVRAFVGPGENVVYPTPSFIVYGLVARICGVEGVGVPCRDYRLDLPAMRAAVTDTTRIVFLCNPNNPTSTYVGEGEVREFLAGLPRDVLVVLDEAYIDYVDAADYPDGLALRRGDDRIAVLRTFSKFFAIAGIRVGYCVASAGVVDVLHRVRQPFIVSRLAEAAGLAALECADDLAPMARETIAERARVREAMLSFGFACPPSQANFVFIDLLESNLDLFSELLARGVVVRRLGQFGAARNTYRVTVGTPAENDRLLDALRDCMRRPSTASSPLPTP